mmetsp:Transcript_30174/g.65043  ORF Transcript_30174/g.65043 Transcript_30174/m.65043 type:complete len:224 (-) Transcript_30174:368-1039(-)
MPHLWIRSGAKAVIWTVYNVTPVASHLHRISLGSIHRLGVGRQGPVGRGVTRQAGFEGHARVAELLVVKPMDDASHFLDEGLVVIIHQVLSIVIPSTVEATTSLFPEGLDIEGHVFEPTFEDILQNVAIFELQLTQVDLLGQGMCGVLRDQLHQFGCQLRDIATVAFANQGIPIETQEHLHPLANGQGLVVDDLQKQQMPCQDLVLFLMQVETHVLQPLRSPR